MSLWIIEPREPLIFRDGRPFGAYPGVRAQSLPFPVPSTTTGAARTQVGLDEQGIFTWTSKDQLDRLRQLQVRGPLLIQLPGPGEVQEPLHWFAPTPADALLLKPSEELPQAENHKTKAELRRLVPLRIDDALTDLADLTSPFGPPLRLVGSTRRIKSKPIDEPPSYWHWHVFQGWLLRPSECKIDNWDMLGIHGPQSEVRVHISMDVENHMSRDGALFETRGMEFVASDKEKALFNARQLALVVSIDDNNNGSSPTLEPRSGFSTLGGERRMVYWQRNDTTLPPCPEELVEQIARDKACRVILLTPAYFKNGCHPTELLQEQDGVKPLLSAIAVQRPQVVSGWDFARKSEGGPQGGPKATRRLTPAGSVFFLTLQKDAQGDAAAIERWVHATWMHCIGDDKQGRLDGFGLAVVGTWDGEPQNMEGVK